MKSIILLSLLLLAATLPACAAGQGEAHTAPAAPGQAVLTAFVSIPPQVYFVRQIGGSRVRVQSLVPPGVEPETYDPTPRQIVELSQAKLYFAVGLPFEKVLIPKIQSSMKGVTVVDTQEGIPLRSFAQQTIGALPEQATGTDPHIWLAPELVKRQGATIEKALAAADPAGAAVYEAGLAKLDREMDSLHAAIAASLAGLTGRSFFVFHPAFGYFADEFGLKQVAIETEGKAPGPKQLAEIIGEARRQRVRTIFVEPQFDESRARVIADGIGARVVTINPLAEDYVTNLEAVARSIKSAIE